jgi:hypothetical protein
LLEARKNGKKLKKKKEKKIKEEDRGKKKKPFCANISTSPQVQEELTSSCGILSSKAPTSSIFIPLSSLLLAI